MTSSPPSPEASGSEADADRLAAASPTTPAAELARIAASRPDLHPALAINPATYPDLVDWLRTSPDPAVQTALTQRTTPPAQPEPTQTAPAQTKTEAPAQAADTDANPSPPAPPAATKRRTGPPRPAVIAVVLVTVLVVSSAAWAGIRLLNSEDHSRRTSQPATASAPEPSESPSPGLPEGGLVAPDPSWADGAHEVWSLERGERTSLTTSGDQLFTITASEDHSHVDSVAAYSISGSEPEKQWEVRLPGNRGVPLGVWGDYFFVDNQLIERSSGRVTEASWSAEVMFVIVINDMAIACDERDACEAWRASDPFSRAWSATIKASVRRG